MGWRDGFGIQEMKISELLGETSLIAPNDFDKSGSPLRLRNMYDNKDYGKRQKATAQTVTVKSSGKDGKIYGRRTLMQK
jgi:hypothetical protein